MECSRVMTITAWLQTYRDCMTSKQLQKNMTLHFQNQCRRISKFLTKQLLAEGKLPPWKEINIRCHDFRVEFCTRAYYAQVPLKTLQSWMGHADADMILAIYTKLDKEQERTDAAKMVNYLTRLEVDSAAE